MLFNAEMGRSQRIKKIDGSKCAPRSSLFHCRPERADDLIHPETLRRGCQVLEVHDMVLDLGTKERLFQWAPGENDNTVKSGVRLQQAKAFAADQACCTEE